VGADGAQGPAGPAGADGAAGADGVGVPTGGTTGQVLAKASNTNFDAEWVDPGTPLSPLLTEMLADSPRALWICDESSGTTLTDSSGNGYDLTLSGNYTLQRSPLLRTEISKQFVKFDTTGRATRSGNLGISVPWNGDITICAVVLVEGNISNPARLFTQAGVGETEATNYQATIQVTNSTYDFIQLWEYGAGANEQVESFTPVEEGGVVFLTTRKNGTANTVDFFKNGKLVRTTSYANEPTGGSSSVPNLGFDGTMNTSAFIIGYVGVYNTALSNARIAAYANAAGLF
jgi:hypothetical protein